MKLLVVVSGTKPHMGAKLDWYSFAHTLFLSSCCGTVQVLRRFVDHD